MIITYYLGITLLFLGLVSLWQRVLAKVGSVYAVTNKRVIIKTGCECPAFVDLRDDEPPIRPYPRFGGQRPYQLPTRRSKKAFSYKNNEPIRFRQDKNGVLLESPVIYTDIDHVVGLVFRL